jgi:tripartite-type tricarboxylate transporter receptor subunit TctC
MNRLCRAALALAIAACAVAAGAAWAQAYPSRPLRMVIPFPPGGGLDTVGRVVAAGLGERLGVQVVVDNRGGASGTIGTREAERAPPDGYTVLFGSSDTLTVLPLLRSNLSFDILPVAKAADLHILFAAHPGFAARSLSELITLAKEKPGTIRFASPGHASISHMTFEYFKALAGLDIVHVPFNGGGPAAAAVIGGHVELVSGGLNLFRQINAGQLRPLALAAPQRSRLLPEVPTTTEAGYGDVRVSSWFGLFAPRGTSPEIVSRLGREVVALGSAPGFQERVAAVGGEAAPLPAEPFVRFLDEEKARWTRIISSTKIKLDE